MASLMESDEDDDITTRFMNEDLKRPRALFPLRDTWTRMKNLFYNRDDTIRYPDGTLRSLTDLLYNYELKMWP